MCLGEYEMDEMLRRLPACKHEFHQSCIDEWLASHTTCPMCRCSLQPPPAEVHRCIPLAHPLLLPGSVHARNA